MPRSTRHRIVLVTAPDAGVARRLARSALEARLVACANLVPGVESHYWWQGALESATEVLILFKTTGARVAALERLVRKEHPYETPEFLALSPGHGSAAYLDWITDSVVPTPARRRRRSGHDAH
ncbi:MAG: divalent-cation tolerance protein CutA [Verrucomicrobiae bacterium]|nr:divalent-cation tolerance protein CutA [Verrucomicrobiae bacterium]